MSEELDLQTEEVQAQESPSMDDTIRQTLEAIEARGSEPQEQNEDGRARDEHGRFKKKEEEAAEEVPAEPVAEATEQKPEEAKPEVVVPPEVQKLGIRKDEYEALAQNPVALQAFMRRSEEMKRGFEQIKGKAKFGDAMERAIAPYAPILQQAGISPDVAVQRLFGAHQAITTGSMQQRIGALHQLATEAGVSFDQVKEYAANQPQVDPQVQQLQTRLEQMQSWIQQQNQAREWSERQTLNSEIERFASDPSNAYFEEVRGDMAGLLQAGIAPDLKTAYDMAIYANPSVRAKVLADQQAKAEEARRAEAIQKAKVAKTAAAVNIPRKAAVPAARPVGSMDDTIREKARELGLLG